MKWCDGMNQEGLGAQIDAKLTEQCKPMAEVVVREARRMEPLPLFSDPLPDRYKPTKGQKFFAGALQRSRGKIRSVFGLPAGENVTEPEV